MDEEYINVAKNPIECDCELLWFKKFLELNKSFYKIANIKSQKSNYNKIIQNRLKWYYQQVLKISFIIDFYLKNKKNIIIWDADTIILKKI
jgi:hypothetical protein